MMPLLLSLIAAMAATGPQPSVMRTFGQWAVACDNTKRCEAVTLTSSTGQLSDVEVRMIREAGPGAPLEIRFNIPYEANEAVRVIMDGSVVAQLRTKGIDAVVANGNELGARLADARMAAISDGNYMDAITTLGVSAILRYMDAQQGRAGGVTAIVARGAAPASKVPAAPGVPVVRNAVQASPINAPRPSVDMGSLRKLAGCPYNSSGPTDDPPRRLDAHTTYVGVNCGDISTNLMTVPTIIRNGTPKLAALDTMRPGETISMLANAYWDKSDILVSRYLTNGSGNCGVERHYAWDGERLRLVQELDMPECRGVSAWLTTWRAQATR